MIVKGQVRRADSNWIKHLQRTDHNEEVRVVEARALAHDDIAGAIAEMDAYAIGTRCQKPLFDVVLRPTAGRPATDAEFARALDLIEERYPGLKGQPRLVIAHVKDGVEHRHASWARCSADAPAVNLPWTKTNLMHVSAAMFREMGVEPPAGIIAFEAANSKAERKPTNDMDVPTFKTAERQGIDGRDLSAVTVAAWKSGDFAGEMRKAGYEIAKGDRRGFVLVDHAGDVISLRGLLKPLDLKAKEIRAVLGPEEKAQGIEEARTALQPPDRTTASKFNALGAKSGAAVERITLKQGLQTKKAELDELKAKQQEFEKLLTDTFNDHRRATVGKQYYDENGKLIPGVGLPPAQLQEVAGRLLAERFRKDRQKLVDEIKRDREELKRVTLRQHAERIVQMARAALDRLAERFKPKPTPAKPIPQESQAKPVHPLPGRPTAEQFKEAFKEMGQESDRGRERTITPPRQPTTRPKGPGV